MFPILQCGVGPMFSSVFWNASGPFSCNVPDIQKDIFEKKPPQNLDFKWQKNP